MDNHRYGTGLCKRLLRDSEKANKYVFDVRTFYQYGGNEDQIRRIQKQLQCGQTSELKDYFKTLLTCIGECESAYKLAKEIFHDMESETLEAAQELQKMTEKGTSLEATKEALSQMELSSKRAAGDCKKQEQREKEKKDFSFNMFFIAAVIAGSSLAVVAAGPVTGVFVLAAKFAVGAGAVGAISAGLFYLHYKAVEEGYRDLSQSYMRVKQTVSIMADRMFELQDQLRKILDNLEHNEAQDGMCSHLIDDVCTLATEFNDSYKLSRTCQEKLWKISDSMKLY